MDKECRPKPRDMRLWVDLIKFIKERAPGGQLEFFTYMELVIWLVTFLFFRIQRLKYFFFVLFAFGFWSRDQVPAKGAKGRRGRAVKGQQDGGNDMEETEPRFHLSLSKLVSRAARCRFTRPTDACKPSPSLDR